MLINKKLKTFLKNKNKNFIFYILILKNYLKFKYYIIYYLYI